MSWQNPVFDRTLEDVQQRRPKGFLNVTDIRRIMVNMNLLAYFLRLRGMDIPFSGKEDYFMYDIVHRETMEELLEAIDQMASYCVPGASPLRPRISAVDYMLINDMERYQAQSRQALDESGLAMMYCGDTLYLYNHLSL